MAKRGGYWDDTLQPQDGKAFTPSETSNIYKADVANSRMKEYDQSVLDTQQSVNRARQYDNTPEVRGGGPDSR